eukprot:8897280-Pyramimonas_sp.AAC.1
MSHLRAGGVTTVSRLRVPRGEWRYNNVTPVRRRCDDSVTPAGAAWGVALQQCHTCAQAV